MRSCVLMLTLLATGADSRPADLTRERAALLAADRAHGRGGRGFLAVFADDAAYLHRGAPLIRGKDAIRAFLDTTFGAAGVALTSAPVFADVSLDATRGYTYGWTRLSTRGEGGAPVVERGKYLACWRKAAGGSWRIVAYVRNVADSTISPAAPRPLPPEPSLPSRRGPADPTELLGVDARFAAASVAQGAKAAFLAFAAEDAVTLPGGAGVRYGRDAISAAFNDTPAGAVLDWTPLLADVAGTGDLGCTVGEAVFTVPGADGTPRRTYGKYVTVWKRQADGEWRFVADAGNARPAP